jgi:hypothetical protein
LKLVIVVEGTHDASFFSECLQRLGHSPNEIHVAKRPAGAYDQGWETREISHFLDTRSPRAFLLKSEGGKNLVRDFLRASVHYFLGQWWAAGLVVHLDLDAQPGKGALDGKVEEVIKYVKSARASPPIEVRKVDEEMLPDGSLASFALEVSQGSASRRIILITFAPSLEDLVKRAVGMDAERERGWEGPVVDYLFKMVGGKEICERLLSW